MSDNNTPENAAAGWYPQEDGSQRYWDGEAWTEHTAPGAAATGVAATSSGPEGTARPWWRRKRVLIPAGALVLFAFIGAVSSGGDDDPGETPVADATETDDPTEGAEEPVTFVMPALVGENLQDAQDSLQALGSYLMEQEDASGEDRMQLVDSNWRVCAQEPAAGDEVSTDASVILSAVKLDEACPGDEASEPVETEQAAEPDETEAPAEPAEPAMTVSQEQATRSAESYLAFSEFSRSGLIGQLEYEGFTNADATFAVDSLGVDWNAQAAGSAESYLDFSAFSRTGLIEQLEYEGFSTDQATYGVDAVGADWMEQAALSAESYLELMSFSRSGLIDQLVYEGFTREQAEHGANSVGL